MIGIGFLKKKKRYERFSAHSMCSRVFVQWLVSLFLSLSSLTFRSSDKEVQREEWVSKKVAERGLKGVWKRHPHDPLCSGHCLTGKDREGEWGGEMGERKVLLPKLTENCTSYSFFVDENRRIGKCKGKTRHEINIIFRLSRFERCDHLFKNLAINYLNVIF